MKSDFVPFSASDSESEEAGTVDMRLRAGETLIEGKAPGEDMSPEFLFVRPGESSLICTFGGTSGLFAFGGIGGGDSPAQQIKVNRMQSAFN